MIYKKLHNWNITPKEAINIQNELKKLLKFKKFEKETFLVAGVDLSFPNKYGLAVIVVLDQKFNIKEIVHHIEKVKFPYIPGLLAFREGPIFLKAWEKLKTNVDIVFFDGHGIAHPRKLGIASHMGLWIEKPTIGIAKSKLVGNYKEPEKKHGSFSYLEYSGERLGIVYRSKDNVKPIFISPGYLIDIGSSLKITKLFIGKYKLPEPTRLAHIYTQKIKKKFLSC
ncbi:endonuclease V [Thermosipho affectus]|uniref:Endonuclease V n=1 Tax=Thermosipho affectus TaxID=660294 RepID=A0ABX3IJK7_9BACT|nr:MULTISPECIES: endonuclease V [Thermosipho]ANQ54414.1 endonuclease V [Thermosipho sp. 1070]APT72858.1 endonuclease V [Thermosipho sp. 1063]ONN26848.1 endonuclease V [Thermosipho affectus]OOC42293.1 endonuclease V [Thermosipho sp. 1074]